MGCHLWGRTVSDTTDVLIKSKGDLSKMGGPKVNWLSPHGYNDSVLRCHCQGAGRHKPALVFPVSRPHCLGTEA